MNRIIFFFIIACSSITAMAQNITGSWQGSIPAGGKNVRLIFNVTKNADGYTTTFDSPDQNAYGISCSNTSFINDSLFIEIKLVNGGYKGKWNGGDEIKGVYAQNGSSTAFDMKRLSNAEIPHSAAVQPKPQTPKPPFAYISEDVTYNNIEQRVNLAGTLTKPAVGTKFPVVLLITGSGAQDRNETIGMHKPFWVIADYLTNQGIAVLRVDDRGIGGSTGDFRSSSSADFATDVMAGINYLKTRSDIDVSKIGLLGHSEGGLIAPYVAVRSKDVAFIVSLAGAVVGGKAVNDFQNTLPMLQSGVSKENVASFLELHHPLVDAAITVSNDSVYKTMVQQIFTGWKQKQTSQTIQALVKGPDDLAIQSMQRNYGAFRNAWWKFFLTYEPINDLQTLKIPVLALNGEKDEQVEPVSNLAIFKDSFKKGNKNSKTIEIPGVNHLFQHCKVCGSIPEYLALEETFDTATLSIIGNWIKEQVK